MRHSLTALAATVLLCLTSPSALGQGGNTPGNSPGGILISPQGLIQQALATPISPAQPSRQLREKALTALPETLRQPVEARLLSLRSLDSRWQHSQQPELPSPPNSGTLPVSPVSIPSCSLPMAPT